MDESTPDEDLSPYSRKERQRKRGMGQVPITNRSLPTPAVTMPTPRVPSPPTASSKSMVGPTIDEELESEGEMSQEEDSTGEEDGKHDGSEESDSDRSTSSTVDSASGSIDPHDLLPKFGMQSRTKAGRARQAAVALLRSRVKPIELAVELELTHEQGDLRIFKLQDAGR